MTVRRQTEALVHCAVCDVILSKADWIDAEDGTVVRSEWQHPLRPGPEPDHTPVPVVAADSGAADGECDFCGQPRPEWLYATADFPIGADPLTGFVHMSRGAWSACSFCTVLIDADEIDELIERAWTIQKAKHGGDLPALARASIVFIHQEWAKHRLGPRERIRGR